ncbi:MAG: malto-oligosyltrehalose trehalohydrolase [Thermodesulfovibrionales bacterium]|jgi:maltooligosyltrehalose trehalohydrolase
MRIGAWYKGDGVCRFTVWAPLLKGVEVRIISPSERLVPMNRLKGGYWTVEVEDCYPGALYLYLLEGKLERPDPASSFQPRGVHGPSQVVDHSGFPWTDSGWRGVPLSEMIMYETHVGTFTPEGSFEAIIPRLPELRELGINALELMPVAQSPGERNWGYDGVYPFSVQDSYGGPEGLRRLVDACHSRGMAVILDVVYNHLGPEGNYLQDFGPCFTDKYRTPWGSAVNFDDSHSDGVRNFFIENSLHWSGNYHIDGLRIDAIHGITDMSSHPFLRELAERADNLSEKEGRPFLLIAESDLNDPRAIRPRELGGFGMAAQWCDDFHHSLHTLLTGERDGYYKDFGSTGDLVKSLRAGFVYSGQYSAYRQRRHGSSSVDRPAHQFILFSQNHDQVGNRMMGERLSSLVSFEALKVAAGAVLLSPGIPLLFMGEDYGEDAPFLYFVSHTDPGLTEAVREGRKREFSSFLRKGEIPDPSDEGTFVRSRLQWEKRGTGRHTVLLKFYRTVISTRKTIPALSHISREGLEVSGSEASRVVVMRRRDDRQESEAALVFNFSRGDEEVIFPFSGSWRKLMDSADTSWDGPGSSIHGSVESGERMILRAESFCLFIREGGQNGRG